MPVETVDEAKNLIGRWMTYKGIYTEFHLYDKVIMNQWCDIQNNKINNAFLCPILVLDEMGIYLSRWPYDE
jgi:hypothetical protein